MNKKLTLSKTYSLSFFTALKMAFETKDLARGQRSSANRIIAWKIPTRPDTRLPMSPACGRGQMEMAEATLFLRLFSNDAKYSIRVAIY